jgi:hypothetical protein
MYKTLHQNTNNNPVHSPFMAYHRFRNKSNTAGSTCGAGTDYFPEQLSSPPVFIELCVARSLVFWCSVLYINACHLVLFCSVSFELRLLIKPSKMESSNGMGSGPDCYFIWDMSWMICGKYHSLLARYKTASYLIIHKISIILTQCACSSI